MYAPLDAYAYQDGLGRTIQVVSSGDTSQQWVLSGQVTRDARGRVTAAFVPTFIAASSGGSVAISPPTGASTGMTYDAFSRVLTTTDIDGTPTATNAYHAGSLDMYDAETVSTGGKHAGAFVTMTQDGHGRTVSALKRGNGGSVTTTTTYQATGEVTSMSRIGTDTYGPVTYQRWMQYDTLGRLIVNAEPNASSDPLLRSTNSAYWLYAYDDLGDLVGTSDPRACGENIAYDGAGRLQSENYSPCDSVNQAPYTPPSTAAGDGDGTEAFYVYEGPSLQTGQLSDVYDRASHSHLTHDARGRLIEVDRQIANPGTPTSALSSRYSPTIWTATMGYDDRDRITTQSTGADVSQLESSNAKYTGHFGPSAVGVTYSTRGNLQTATGSYGPLVTGLAIEADGRPDSMTYADAAQTTLSYAYKDSRRRLTQVLISRAKPFPSATSTYTPPPANAAQPTQQTVLANDVTVIYDQVNNPILTEDERIDAEWPTGAKPVTSHTYAYDDSYRVTSVTNTYNAGTDPYTPPLASNMPDTSPLPMSVTPASRVLSQTFTYDGLGNLMASTDDANIFPERSLGKPS